MNSSIRHVLKRYSTSAKPLVIPNSNVINDIDNNVYKYKKHPGINLPRTVLLPESFIKAVINVLADYPVKGLIESSEKLTRHLKGRVAPMEKLDLREKVSHIQEKVLSKYNKTEFSTVEDEMNFKHMVEHKIQRSINKQLYNWKPIKYDINNSLLYLIGRSAAEYATLVKIFGEIETRDPSFKPKSIFDYGSGVGTASWAANLFWKKYILEYFNVDTSRDMNDLAQMLLQGGHGTPAVPIKGVFYRQFLPATPLNYDLVVSSFSMFELPSSKNRLETILNLWNKTAKYLVIVEQGSNAGFKVVNELRDFLLQIDKEGHKCTVFSPCSHDAMCPRFLLDDGTPCNFEVSYHSLPLVGHSEVKSDLYSYVVLQKGNVEHCAEERWPRVVRPTLVRSKHTICRLCTSNGKLQEVIFTTGKHGKTMYHCSRATKWGDRLPVNIQDSEKCDINQ
ncbi:methyltransferase-like protein 17, mitochondrial [Diabrotica virgifera virgifera]|uniref:Methyltransferase-like protein 17, mitochondrial n=1 Tax=Diabrotica virgifera virgifera TaxID=50390 RepID=A0ABM5IE17_DIAVI|nr:methyltransferase-like protein 17, mitochondrial [Diabrotica virgifera virgifera]